MSKAVDHWTNVTSTDPRLRVVLGQGHQYRNAVASGRRCAPNKRGIYKITRRYRVTVMTSTKHRRFARKHSHTKKEGFCNPTELATS